MKRPDFSRARRVVQSARCATIVTVPSQCLESPTHGLDDGVLALGVVEMIEQAPQAARDGRPPRCDGRASAPGPRRANRTCLTRGWSARAGTGTPLGGRHQLSSLELGSLPGKGWVTAAATSHPASKVQRSR